MIRQARESYEVAVDQEVDLRRTPCIYDDGGDWVAAVDYDRRGFEAAASACPSFESGAARHAVVLDRDGDVIAAR